MISQHNFNQFQRVTLKSIAQLIVYICVIVGFKMICYGDQNAKIVTAQWGSLGPVSADAEKIHFRQYVIDENTNIIVHYYLTEKIESKIYWENTIITPVVADMYNDDRENTFKIYDGNMVDAWTYNIICDSTETWDKQSRKQVFADINVNERTSSQHINDYRYNVVWSRAPETDTLYDSTYTEYHYNMHNNTNWTMYYSNYLYVVFGPNSETDPPGTTSEHIDAYTVDTTFIGMIYGDQLVSSNQTSKVYTSEYSMIPNGLAAIQTNITTTYTLSDEYATSDLIEYVTNKLGNIAYGGGWVTKGGSASSSLADDETSLIASKGKIRVSIPTQTGKQYKVFIVVSCTGTNSSGTNTAELKTLTKSVAGSGGLQSFDCELLPEPSPSMARFNITGVDEGGQIDIPGKQGQVKVINVYYTSDSDCLACSNGGSNNGSATGGFADGSGFWSGGDAGGIGEIDPGDDTQTCGSTEQNMLNLDLGKTFEGASAGTLTIDEQYPSAMLSTPAALRLLSASSAVDGIPDPATGYLKQIKAPQCLVTVNIVDAYQYNLKIFPAGSFNSNMGADGLYATTGAPSVIWTIQNTNGSTNHLTLNITETRATATTTNNYVRIFTWASDFNSMELMSGNGLKKELWNTVWSADRSERATTHRILDPANGATLYQTVENHSMYSNGEVAHLNSRVVGVGSDALTTTYSYYASGYLNTVLNADGSWIKYVYETNDAGRVVEQQSGLLNSGPSDSSKRTINYSYTPVGTNDTGTLALEEPRMVCEKIDGVIVSLRYLMVYANTNREIIRKEMQCVVPNAKWTNDSNLVTTKTYYGANSTYMGWLKSVEHPNGTMDVYSYEQTANNQTTKVYSGVPNGTGGIAEGTLTINVTDNSGNVLSHSVEDISTGLTLSLDSYSGFDAFGRAAYVTHLGSIGETRKYGSCGLESVVSNEGITNQYYYDGLKRQTETAIYGGPNNSVSHRTTLDAAGNVLVRKRIGCTNDIIVQSQYAYDTAGRLISEINALNGVTVYSDTVTNGQRSKKTTQLYTHASTTMPWNPNSGRWELSTTNYQENIERIETWYRDGSLQSISGSGVHPVAYRNYADTAGERYVYECKINNNAATEEKISVYDMIGRIKRVEYSDGALEGYGYNNKGQLTYYTNLMGVVTQYDYNTKGELTTSTLAPDTTNQRITKTTTSYANNARRVETSAGVSVGSLSSVSVDETSLDGLTHTITLKDGSSELKSITTDAINQSTGIRLVTETRPDNTKTLSTYKYGRLLSVSTRDSQNTEISLINYYYDAHNRVQYYIDNINRCTTNNYNAADQIVLVVSPKPDSTLSPLVTQYRYDQWSRLTNIVHPDGLQTCYLLNPKGELLVKYGRHIPLLAAFGYDDQGRMISMTNLIDGYGSISGEVYAEPSFAGCWKITRWAYDTNRGWLKKKSYPPTAYSGAASDGEQYTYYTNGLLHTRVTPRGVTSTYSYNAAGELTNTTYSGSGSDTPNVTLVRDYLGRITNATSVLGSDTIDQVTCEYNGYGQQKSENHTAGLLSGFTVSSGYDSVYRRNSLNITGNSASYAVSMLYDSSARLNNVAIGTDSVVYDYKNNSTMPWKTRFLNGSTAIMMTEKIYDDISRLKSVANSQNGNKLLGEEYIYSLASQRTQAVRTDLSLAPDTTTTWTYKYQTSGGELAQATRRWNDGTAVRNQDFSYGSRDGGRFLTANDGRRYDVTFNGKNELDSRMTYWISVLGTANASATVTATPENGKSVVMDRHNSYYSGNLQLDNRSSAIYTNVIVEGAVNNGAQTVLKQTNAVLVAQRVENSTQLTYDLDGNPTADSLWKYEWDAENRLTKMTSQLLGSRLAVKRIEFQYDWQGRRIAKRCYDAGSNGNLISSQHYLYDGWNLIAVANATNGIQATYVWGQDLSGSLQGAGGVGGLLFVRDHRNSASVATHCVCYDGNGNVVALIKNDGTISAQYEHGPFGEPTRITGDMAKINPFRFSTKYTDDETGLLYYGYRYYNPAQGRWLSRDPSGESGGINLYAFCQNDPINNIDVLGLSCECAKSIKIQNVKKINKRLKGGVDVIGHEFEVAIDLDYKDGDGKATLEWWEKADIISPWYPDEVKPNKWYDIYQEFKDTGLVETFNTWDSRDTKTMGLRTLILKDTPTIGIPIHGAKARTLEFRIVVNNPQCCACRSQSVEVTAKQVLAEDFTKEPTFINQTFITPNAP